MWHILEKQVSKCQRWGAAGGHLVPVSEQVPSAGVMGSLFQWCTLVSGGR